MSATDLHVPSATTNPLNHPPNRRQLPATRPAIMFPVVTHSREQDLRHALILLGVLIGVCLGATGCYGFVTNDVGPDGATCVIIFIVLCFLLTALLQVDESGWMSLLIIGGFALSAYFTVTLLEPYRYAVHAFLSVWLVRESLRFRQHTLQRASIGMLDARTVREFRAHRRLPRGLKPAPLIAGYIDALVSYLTYNRCRVDVPGIFRSPVGDYRTRLIRLTALVFCLTYAGCLVSVPEMIESAGQMLGTPFTLPTLVHLFLGVPFAGLTLTIGAAFLFTASFAGKAYALKSKQMAPAHWGRMLSGMWKSSDSIEKRSLWLGMVDYDRSPILYPFKKLFTHAWIVGKTGSGKTAFLRLLLDQIVRRGTVSLIHIDLKSITHETLATIKDANAYAERVKKSRFPLKHFTLNHGESTHLFNIFGQEW